MVKRIKVSRSRKKASTKAGLGTGIKWKDAGVKIKKKRKNIDTRGRILGGPSGGQWTSGKARQGPPSQQIENCGWLRKKKKKVEK